MNFKNRRRQKLCIAKISLSTSCLEVSYYLIILTLLEQTLFGDSPRVFDVMTHHGHGLVSHFEFATTYK